MRQHRTGVTRNIGLRFITQLLSHSQNPLEVVTMASSGKFRTSAEALASSAAHVIGQGEDLASAHMTSDSQAHYETLQALNPAHEVLSGSV
jgi:hypothetical protein